MSIHPLGDPMHPAQKQNTIHPIYYGVILCLLNMVLVSVVYAEESQASFERLTTAAESNDDRLVNELLPVVISNSDTLSEPNYTDVSAKTSVLLRTNKQHEAVTIAANYLNSDAAQMIQQAVRYRWMMIMSYDLMFFTEFAAARDMIEQELDSIKAWTPITKDSKVTQANLYHIYGQLLVRQKRVAEALPYFYQAEHWFKDIDKNHPSIFVINILLGEAFLHARSYEQAEEFARKALKTIPAGRVDAISYLYAILAAAVDRQKRPQDAMQIISTYLANPVDPRRDYFLYFSLVHIDVLRHLEQFEPALALAKETYLLAQQVGNKDYLKDAKRQLGFLQAYFNNMTEAENLLQEAINSPSGIRQANPPQAYLDYVEVLEQLGNNKSALDYYRRYHNAYVEEFKRINQIAIANLEYQQENQRLEQQQALSVAQLALAKANENRALLQTRALMWAALILTLIATAVFVMWLQLRSKSRQLHIMAVEDQLTKLGNRHAFLQALDKPDYTVLVIADIDGLKYYNDRYGHQKGDELIKQYAQQLKQRLESVDAGVFRIGGDEFAILMAHSISTAQIDEWMKKTVVQTQRAGFPSIDASYGIAKRSEATKDHDWISLADQRMYAMKEMNKQTAST
ncbi:GGDEF domain-containing protein [Marinomonas sp. IMCC 4694]|uniref:tetratricopeptide repeat-containing diguanylate cyclase n=1 Tax=Marinomonas sp. IMCC 4694 TaxID=2605432 RepID=UPI0011E665DD|nr:GGDEF domain-containing protein [Marinomonas sp. IMCC 4694]TYL47989.1 GGDEF domain-containing protein [Marinomonas sp. IMCC 4694]